MLQTCFLDCVKNAMVKNNQHINIFLDFTKIIPVSFKIPTDYGKIRLCILVYIFSGYIFTYINIEIRRNAMVFMLLSYYITLFMAIMLSSYSSAQRFVIVNCLLQTDLFCRNNDRKVCHVCLNIVKFNIQLLLVIDNITSVHPHK